MLSYGACRFPNCPAACSKFTRTGAPRCGTPNCNHKRGFHEEIDAVTQVDPALQVRTLRGPTHSYVLGWPLGSGQYGEVFDAVQVGTNARVAIKKMELPPAGDPQRTYLEREIQNMQRLDHPNIVRLVDHFSEEPFVYIVLERVQGTELFDKVGSPKLRLTISLGAGQHDPAFFDGLRRAIARSLKVSPERVNVPISNGAVAELRVDVYPPGDIADQFEDITKFLGALQRAVESQGLGINANFGATLVSAKTLSHSPLDEATALRYFRQILCAVKYMHENGVVHRDLKLENTMVDPTTRTLKLIDFGFSRSTNSVLMSFVGTQHYMAPEMFTGQQYSGEAVDIWAIGVMLYLMLSGTYPFGTTGGQMFLTNPALNVPGLLARLPAGVRELLGRIFLPQPASRVTLGGVMADHWVRAGLHEDPPEVQRAFGADAMAD